MTNSSNSLVIFPLCPFRDPFLPLHWPFHPRTTLTTLTIRRLVIIHLQNLDNLIISALWSSGDWSSSICRIEIIWSSHHSDQSLSKAFQSNGSGQMGWHGGCTLPTQNWTILSSQSNIWVNMESDTNSIYSSSPKNLVIVWASQWMCVLEPDSIFVFWSFVLSKRASGHHRARSCLSVQCSFSTLARASMDFPSVGSGGSNPNFDF